MKSILSLIVAGALLLSAPGALAAPVEASPDPAAGSIKTTTSASNTTAKASAQNYGSPRCRDSLTEALCTASNVQAYCNDSGFHCKLGASCQWPACWCQ